MLDLNYLSPDEPGVNWWIIGMHEANNYCGEGAVYAEQHRICTREHGHRGPHVSGRRRIFQLLKEDKPILPIQWYKLDNIFEITGVDYATYELR